MGFEFCDWKVFAGRKSATFVTSRVIYQVQWNEMFILNWNQIDFFESWRQDNEHVFQKENDPVQLT